MSPSLASDVIGTGQAGTLYATQNPEAFNNHTSDALNLSPVINFPSTESRNTSKWLLRELYKLEVSQSRSALVTTCIPLGETHRSPRSNSNVSGLDV